jgi:glucosylceramidase
MKNSLPLLILGLATAFGLAQPPAQPSAVTVFTTAEKTDARLTRTDTKAFQPSAQPLETEICIFVNPDKTFQTFLGIGQRQFTSLRK